MNSDGPPEMPDVDALTRSYVDAQERLVDAQRILDSVRTRQAHAAGVARGPRARQAVNALVPWGVAVAAAASLVVVAAWTLRRRTAHAETVQLVRDARGALKDQVDRSYRIHIELAPGGAELYAVVAMLASPDSSLLARSDRLRIEAAQPDRTWTCGRDELRRVWIAPALTWVSSSSLPRSPAPRTGPRLLHH